MTDPQRMSNLEQFVRDIERLLANDRLAATYPTISTYRRGMLKSIQNMAERRQLRAAA